MMWDWYICSFTSCQVISTVKNWEEGGGEVKVAADSFQLSTFTDVGATESINDVTCNVIYF